MGTTVLVRRNVWTLAAGDTTVADYARAVHVMMGRQPSDPTSWSYQAAMHGTHAKQVKPLWNECRHGTWYFVAWHRMFIYYFERIVRAAVVAAGGEGGPNTWTLPFWDYEAGGQQATLPLAFRQPATSANALFVQRSPGINAGHALSRAVTSARHAMNCASFVGNSEFGGGITGVAQFSGQYGQLENQPHNVVHSAIGGIMGDPQAAAADPIFWLHHANIDRLWHIWAGPAHPAPTDARWSQQSFEFFDEHGQSVSRRAVEVLDIEGQLDYTYEPSPPAAPTAVRQFAMATAGGFAQPPQLEPVGISETPVTLRGVPASVEVTIDERAASSFLQARGETTPAHIYLELDDITGDKDPGTVYGVYVNLPDGAATAVVEAHHAASLSFFGIERSADPVGDEPPHGLSLTRDITTLVNQLAAGDEWDGTHMTITFRPLGLVPPDQPDLAHALPDGLSDDDPPVAIGSVRILYA